MPERKLLNTGAILYLTDVRQSSNLADEMKQQPKTITFRPSPQDRKLVDKLASRLGIKTSQVIKIALRRFAEAEGMGLKAS